MSTTNLQARLIGSELAGQGEMHFHGAAVAISQDGSTIAITAPYYKDSSDPDGPGGARGYVQIYRLVEGEWRLEDQFVGEPGDYFGSEAVALSDNGDTVAFTSDQGKNLKIYSQDNQGAWNLETEVPIPKGNGDWDARPLSISGDGKTLAIGVPGYDLPQGGGSDTDEGAVFIYSKQDNNWIKTAEIIGSIANGKSGQSISLSQDGTSLIVGEPNVPSGVSEISGRAVVYKVEGNTWLPVGDPIDSDDLDSNPARGGGTSVSISANGRIIAVGYPGTQTDGASVRVFELDTNDDTWVQRGPTILEDSFDPNSPSSFGRTLALSADGNTLAIGLPDGEGHVDIFVYDQVNDTYNHADGIQGALGDHSNLILVNRVMQLVGSLPYLMMVAPLSSPPMKGIMEREQ